MHAGDKSRVVITGAGCVLPGSTTPAEFWDRLVSGRTGISAYRDARVRSSHIRCFGSIDDAQAAASLERVPFKLRRYSTASTQWGVKAVSDALACAGLDLGTVAGERRGIFTAQGDYTYPSLSSFTSGIAAAREMHQPSLQALTHEFMFLRGTDPFFAIKSLANNLLAVVSMTFELRGDCGAYVQDESAPAAALQSAAFSLAHGYCDIAVVVCAGSYNEAMTLAELLQSGRLSDCGAGAASLRPFDTGRDGTIPGEGAIALVLETASHARRRGARLLARVDGIGTTVSMAGGDNAYRDCLAQAAQSADTSIERIGAILAGGSGGVAEDAHELRLLSALPAPGRDIPITCATPITGLLPGCPAAWLAAIGMLEHGVVPPIAHLDNPAEAGLRLARREAMQRPLRTVAALSSGVCGSHAAVLFSAVEQ